MLNYRTIQTSNNGIRCSRIVKIFGTFINVSMFETEEVCSVMYMFVSVMYMFISVMYMFVSVMYMFVTKLVEWC